MGGSRPDRPARGPRLLHSHRHTLTLLERARVRVDAGRVVFDLADDRLVRTFNLPHVNLSVLLLGQGSSLTTEAARRLCEENVLVGFTGSGGTPFFLGSMEAYQQTEDLLVWSRIVADPEQRLSAAKRLQIARADTFAAVLRDHHRLDIAPFSECLTTFRRNVSLATDIPQLLGFEGAFTKRLYALFAAGAGIDFKREQGGSRSARVSTDQDVANALIDHGNYLCYGIAAIVLWTLGVPASLAAFHGKTRAGGLVFDLADTFKDAFVLPVAFAHARTTKPEESVFRAALVDALDDGNAIALAFASFRSALEAAA